MQKNKSDIAIANAVYNPDTNDFDIIVFLMTIINAIPGDNSNANIVIRYYIKSTLLNTLFNII